MKLTKIHVKKYQSIKDSNEFDVSDITCLVGKNEAGKTSILKALYKLNPIISIDSKFDDTDDYPRSEVEDYKHDVSSGKKPQRVVYATFELEDEEIEELIEELGENALNTKILELSKGYDNVLYFSISCNENEVYNFLIQNAQLPPDALKGLKSLSGFNKASEYLKTIEQTTQLRIIYSIYPCCPTEIITKNFCRFEDVDINDPSSSECSGLVEFLFVRTREDCTHLYKKTKDFINNIKRE